MSTDQGNRDRPLANFPPLPTALAQLFEVIRPLGMGGMGAVWLVRDPFLDRPIALKVLMASSQDAESRERFLREARTSARLEHPHIIDVFRADETEGTVWFTMRYVDGESLGDRLRERGRLPVVELLQTLREVAWGLAYAHARDVVHRDIKPDNILLDRESGRAVLTDFGIARDVSANASHLTVDGHVLGSVHYMSPEQASGDVVDGRTDVYALGCVAFQALTGRLLFEGSPQSILVAHVTQPAPSLQQVAPDVPASVAELIDQCLCKDPAERVASAEQLAAAFERVIRDVQQLEAQSRDAAPGALMSEGDARAIWQRAAQLQAQAAHRLEQTARLKSAPPSDRADDPSGSYRMRDVEQAAVEAGISRQYVALALAERSAAPAGKASVVVGQRFDHQFTTLLGTSDRAISVSRMIPATAKATLAAIGTVFTGDPYRLTVKDTVNGHPLDGGILRFSLAKGALAATMASQTGRGRMLIYRLHQIELFDLNVTLQTRGTPGQPACEVVITGDLRPGLRKNLLADWAFIGTIGTAGGLGGAIALTGLMGATALVALPAAGLAALSAGLTAAWYRWLFRQALAHTVDELGELLESVERQLTQRKLFSFS